MQPESELANFGLAYAYSLLDEVRRRGFACALQRCSGTETSLASPQHTEAVSYYERALVKNPMFKEAAYNLALSHELLGNDQEAVKWFKEVCYSPPRPPSRLWWVC